MKTVSIKFMRPFLAASMVLVVAFSACERSVDGLSEPDLTQNPDVFLDGFSAGLEYYPYEGSKLDAFTVDDKTTYENSSAAMRFDVPNVGDPSGAYAGAIFRDDFDGRDLTSYNALTFVIKSTTAATVNEIGFGQDFLGNKWSVNIAGLRVGTNWQEVTIPIPDPSKLTASKGLFWYSEGPEDGDGYTFWIDDLKYENLSGMAQPRPAILNGNEVALTSFIGSGTTVSGLTYTINQSNGRDVTVIASAAYFTFASSNPAVATVDELGVVSVLDAGTAEITATLGDVQANGALTVESIGEFEFAPIPSEDASDVISIFSDKFDNVPVDFYNGFYAPFQTTTSNDFEVSGNNVLGYENFNFVGIEFNQNVPEIDGSEMTHLRMDIYFPDAVPAGAALGIKIVDFGADGSFGGGDDTEVRGIYRANTTPALVSGQWISIDLNISSLTNRSRLGQIVLDSDSGPSLAGSSFYVDNIYLRK